MWFALHGKILQKGKHTGILLIQSHNFLIIFLQEREEIASIDLRRMTEFKGLNKEQNSEC